MKIWQLIASFVAANADRGLAKNFSRESAERLVARWR